MLYNGSQQTNLTRAREWWDALDYLPPLVEAPADISINTPTAMATPDRTATPTGTPVLGQGMTPTPSATPRPSVTETRVLLPSPTRMSAATALIPVREVIATSTSTASPTLAQTATRLPPTMPAQTATSSAMARPPTVAPTARPAPGPMRVILANGEKGYAGSEDTTLDAGAVDKNLGGDSLLRVRSPGTKGALLRFDLSSLPPGATIREARLELHSTERSNAGTAEVGLHPLKRGWSEGEATHKLARAGQAWSAPGAANDADGAVAVEAMDGINRTFSWDVTGLVASWYGNPGANHGVLVRAAGAAAVEYALASTEHANAGWRPRLIIVYQPGQ